MWVATHRHESLFTAGRRVLDREREFIFEGNRCVGEVDSVFLSVRLRLLRIPLNSHVNQYMYICTPRQDQRGILGKLTVRIQRTQAAPARIAVRWNEVLGDAFIHITTIRNLDDVHNEFVILDFIENPERSVANPITRVLS